MNIKKFSIVFSVTLLTLIGIFYHPNDKIIDRSAGMPIVQDTSPHTSSIYCGTPKSDREEKYYQFLAASVKIIIKSNDNMVCSGSGTIIDYNPKTNDAYIISCGHLWDGTKSAQELVNTPVNCEIAVWHHNEQKLKSPQVYKTQVLFWSNVRGFDCSLLRFKPNWQPQTFPVAALDYKIISGMHFNSCGCDSGGEVARYDVQISEFRGNDLITSLNSPRPGRSGGGLLSDDGYLVGICWGTSKTDGSGIGYFTPLKSIHSVFHKNGYDWLLENNSLAKKIPILDVNGKQQKYTPDYIVLPKRDGITVPR